ncbi:DNA/RNA helicase domain-containing protein [Frisingicoccus sp.]
MHSKEAVDEVGCIHSTQGYDLNYAFIILGNEILCSDDQRDSGDVFICV